MTDNNSKFNIQHQDSSDSEMEPSDRDSLQGNSSSVAISYYPHSKAQRKQKLVTLETFEGENACRPFASLVIKFPKLDFGMSEMGKAELEAALTDQFKLHTKNFANETGIDHPNPQELTCDAITDYQKHRLASVSWFVSTMSFNVFGTENRRSTLLQAVNVMDRYITTCVDLGEDLSQLLKNISNIRAACMALSIKMHSVDTVFDMDDLNQWNTGVERADVVDSSNETGSANEVTVYSSTDVKSTCEAEMQIITKLRGAVFPANGETMINVLSKYLILEYLSGQPVENRHLNTADYKNVILTAVDFLSKIAVDTSLLRFKRWKCIAACCFLGVIDVYLPTTEDALCLEFSLISLFGKLKPDDLTIWELCDITKSLTQGCVVCSTLFVCPTVHSSLRKISSMSCCECKNGNVVETTV